MESMSSYKWLVNLLSDLERSKELNIFLFTNRYKVKNIDRMRVKFR